MCKQSIFLFLLIANNVYFNIQLYTHTHSANNRQYLNSGRENDGQEIHPHPVCKHMLTAASLVLTLDILRVINNEVAIPHHREIHRQLTDLHSLVQILQAKKKKRKKKAEDGGGMQKERRISMRGLGICRSQDSLRMPHYVLPKLPRSYITSLSES